MHIIKKIILGIALLFTLWILGFVAFSLSALISGQQGKDETTDAIVALTGGQNRIQEALDLFAQGKASHLFISGVFKDVRKRDITGLWEGEHALPTCGITLGYEATTTEQNAQETREWIIKEDYQSIRLVTGNYHMARSLLELRHAMPGIDIYAHPVKQPNLGVFSKRFWELVFTEYHKYLYRRVQLLFTPRDPLPVDEG